MGVGERDKTRHERHSKIANPTKWDFRLPFSDMSTTVVSENPVFEGTSDVPVRQADFTAK